MKFVLLFLFLSLVSCAAPKSTNSGSYIGVDLEGGVEKKIPLIEGNGNSRSYGPDVKGAETFAKQRAKEIVGLYLYPAGFNSLAYLKVVDNLQKYKTLPSVYSGAGLGAVVAAFLAMGVTPDHIEWKFFALLEKLAPHQYLSDEWKSILFKFLKKEFKNKRIEQLRTALILPVYDKKLGKTRYLSRGSLYNILVINLNLEASRSSKFGSPLMYGNLKIQRLMSKGVDRVAVVNALGEELNFSHANHFLIGIYGKLIGQAKKFTENQNENEKWFNLNLGKRSIDKVQDLQKLILRSLENNEEVMNSLKEFIEKESKK